MKPWKVSFWAQEDAQKSKNLLYLVSLTYCTYGDDEPFVTDKITHNYQSDNINEYL